MKNRAETFITTISEVFSVFMSIILAMAFLAIMGCEDAVVGPVMEPVVDAVTEPTDTSPPTMVGEVKEPEEPAVEPEEQPESTPPADPTPPTVVEVGWYSDWQLTQPITDDVQPGDTIYTVVVFSEAMQHTVADDGTARPVLSIVIDGAATRYRIAAHGASGNTFTSGSAKPFGNGTDDYLCKYTIPADAIGTVAIEIGVETADTAGNTVTEVPEHIAPFVVAEPESTVTLPPGYELPAELIPTEPTVLSADEQALIESHEVSGWDGISPNLQTQAGKTADLISLLPYKDREEVYALFIDSVDLPFFAEAAKKLRKRNIMLGKLWAEYKKTGNLEPWNTFRNKSDSELGIPLNRFKLADIYFEENPQDVPYRDGHSYYWIYLEWYRLQLAYNLPNLLWDPAAERVLLKHFRQSAKKGYIQGLDNPLD